MPCAWRIAEGPIHSEPNAPCFLAKSAKPNTPAGRYRNTNFTAGPAFLSSGVLFTRVCHPLGIRTAFPSLSPVVETTHITGER